MSYQDPPRDDGHDGYDGGAGAGETGDGPQAEGGTRRETHRVRGDDLVQTVKRIVKEGNARRIVIKNDEDRVLLEFPLTAGVVGAAFLPVWAAIGAVAALVTNCSIEVERKEPAE
jgi:hypothetical protein